MAAQVIRYVADGTRELEAGKNLQKYATDAGEPFLFGIKEGSAVSFLAQRGFRDIENMTSEDCEKAYFHGKNAGRVVNSLHSFAYAKGRTIIAYRRKPGYPGPIIFPMLRACLEE